jgi:MFS family permease
VSRTTAAALVFSAAAAMLVLEILALRMLAPYVGLTLETSTTVIGVMLGGIAAGAALGGQAADRGDPRVVLAWALVIGGLLAMATVPVVRLLGDALEGAQDAAALPVATAAFFAPACALSAVTPAVAKLQLQSLDVTGSVVGRLSAWATFGALAGTFTAGFVLVPLLPTTATVLVLGAALVVAGVVSAVRLGGVLTRAGVGVVLLVALLCVLAPVAFGERCDAESEYFCAEVEVDPDRPSGRTLVLDDIDNSYVDLDDPRHLEFAYTRWLAPVLGRSSSVVFVGGGGFTLPRYLAAVRPGSQSRVLEVDRKLLDLARSRLGLGQVPGMSVRIGDARLTLRDERDDSADLVVGDAFSGRVVPWHLTTREFLRDVRRALRPGGVYAMNLIDQQRQRFARAQIATFQDVFDHVVVVGRGEPGARPGGGNIVVFGSERPLPAASLPIGLEGVTVLQGDRVREFVDGADVLRDEHAPTDQLLAPRP